MFVKPANNHGKNLILGKLFFKLKISKKWYTSKIVYPFRVILTDRLVFKQILYKKHVNRHKLFNLGYKIASFDRSF